MTILEKRKLAPERDEHLKKGEFTVLNGEYSKNFNVYVVGEKHKEAVDFIKVALDRSTDNVLGFGIKMGCQKNFNVIVWDEEDIPEEYRVEFRVAILISDTDTLFVIRSILVDCCVTSV